MNNNIKTFYFSATGTTRKIITGLADKLSVLSGGKTAENIDFTLPDARKKPASFAGQDIVLAGLPVYAGRVPNILLKYLNTIAGNGAMAVAVVVYGNRHYDDALMEFKDILEERGLRVIAGGAFIGEHSFSRIIGHNRPDERDMSVVTDFAQRIYRKITDGNTPESISVPGNKPYQPYFQVKDKEGKPAFFHKITPKTSNDCIDCKLCANLCPMGSIDQNNVSVLKGICIKCCACIKNCPMEAKYFDDANYLWHKSGLEASYASPRREPELFL